MAVARRFKKAGEQQTTECQNWNRNKPNGADLRGCVQFAMAAHLKRHGRFWRRSSRPTTAASDSACLTVRPRAAPPLACAHFGAVSLPRACAHKRGHLQLSASCVANKFSSNPPRVPATTCACIPHPPTSAPSSVVTSVHAHFPPLNAPCSLPPHSPADSGHGAPEAHRRRPAAPGHRPSPPPLRASGPSAQRQSPPSPRPTTRPSLHPHPHKRSTSSPPLPQRRRPRTCRRRLRRLANVLRRLGRPVSAPHPLRIRHAAVRSRREGRLGTLHRAG